MADDAWHMDALCREGMTAQTVTKLRYEKARPNIVTKLHDENSLYDTAH